MIVSFHGVIKLAHQRAQQTQEAAYTKQWGHAPWHGVMAGQDLLSAARIPFSQSPWPQLVTYLHFRPAELQWQLLNCSCLCNVVVWTAARCIFNSCLFFHLIGAMAPSVLLYCKWCCWHKGMEIGSWQHNYQMSWVP